MDAGLFAGCLKEMGIGTITGVPDSALKQFCNFMNKEADGMFRHFVPANEGAAVGIAIGSYLATGKVPCVYMQNSGLGNAVNPVTSLANEKVYGIPILFLIGWRGMPGKKDEPQHKFMGEVTCAMLDVLSIPYALLKKDTKEDEARRIFSDAKACLDAGKQFAVVAEPGAFEMPAAYGYKNSYSLIREKAIHEIVSGISESDIIVSTTGKISREVYEQCDIVRGHHKQVFLTVGGMGHASMIAFGIAKEKPEKRVYCLDGDGAALMHMGSLAFIGKQKTENLVHICLNNDAHESVGGMPTGCAGFGYAGAAEACGYPFTEEIWDMDSLRDAMGQVRQEWMLAFLEIKVSIDTREDLGRPKETPAENKKAFMEYLGG
ncbi:phosphonopyruvate decarboxylase [bacterium D16-51]|nr:phosphonopyruvate decarboxylase [bacterium D16-59]RKI62792.1 phosphonopyruvate decarboxylase [bacterium D16-51]